MKLAILSLFFLFNFNPCQKEYGTIELVISETSNDEGVIQLLIFNQEKGWPESLDDAWKIVTLQLKNGTAKQTIPNVPAGNYAITVFHDHDEDGKIRKNKIGYPIDPFGFSNNPSLLFGVPSFEKCNQKVTASKTTRFEIDLR
ncbi:DUF2141 domain-containing protein [Algoriphagus winogradskyi]|jgi:uncharacterized protein (DUF2141 family)|uniref:Uncharacterized conserved protein, DUF2141 family n=1 Tax=Algoriphagus winogradskyi TaxID=237017 RepID=A0ABY1NCJ3_9BACT|nr:DUF2141 domain-containing protein [Algoriphagus winogradskyi]SMP06435.1 Uncharacterized conserved protein, DUF2141 family [Algoriphagus winogradskyi]